MARRKNHAPVTGTDVVSSLKKHLGARTLAEVGTAFGFSLQAVQGWAKRAEFTADQVAKLAVAGIRAARRQASAVSVRPVVEFFRIEAIPSKGGKQFELFESKTHPYRKGLRMELEQTRGVYVFFDSRGQAIYVGKARRLNLWSETKSVFNRERGELQQIRRVRHPARRQDYRSSDEKVRQIVGTEVPLHELAAYFSAYEAPDAVIDELEALLVRSFSNNLLNKKMEHFTRERRRRKAGRRRRRRAATKAGRKAARRKPKKRPHLN